MDNTDAYLLNFKGYYLIRSTANTDLLKNLEEFEVRHDDVFIVTYPKSGKFEEWATCSHLHSGLVIHVYRGALFYTLTVAQSIFRRLFRIRKKLK